MAPITPAASSNGAATHNLFTGAGDHTPPPVTGNGGQDGRGRGLVVAVDEPQPASGERNARPPADRAAARPYGALLAFVACGALLLATGWLGLSLRAATGKQAALRAQRAAVTHALTDARAQTRTLTLQRDQARRTATAAQARAQHAAQARQPKGQRIQRPPADARNARKASRDRR